jgi:hypothetical protein
MTRTLSGRSAVVSLGAGSSIGETRSIVRTRAALVGIAVATAIGALAPAGAAVAVTYPPTGSCVVDPTAIDPGDTVRFSCVAETFGASEPVTITVTGENGADAEIGVVRFAVSTAAATSESTSSGALGSTPITFPEGSSGNYTITAVSPSSAGGSATVTVRTTGGGIPGLSTTGQDSSRLLGLWAAGGALVLSGATLALWAALRRHGAAS